MSARPANPVTEPGEGLPYGRQHSGMPRGDALSLHRPAALVSPFHGGDYAA